MVSVFFVVASSVMFAEVVFRPMILNRPQASAAWSLGRYSSLKIRQISGAETSPPDSERDCTKRGELVDPGSYRLEVSLDGLESQPVAFRLTDDEPPEQD